MSAVGTSLSGYADPLLSTLPIPLTVHSTPHHPLPRSTQYAGEMGSTQHVGWGWAGNGED